MTGRPSTFTDAKAADICRRIAEGESLVKICRDDAMPDIATVFRWLADERRLSFRDSYVRAREMQMEAMAAEILEIADDGRSDYTVTEDGIEVVNHDHIQRSRLRVDTRKWLMSKLAPKKYGDKIEHTGDVTHSFVALLPAKSASEEDWEKAHAPPLLEHVKPKGRG